MSFIVKMQLRNTVIDVADESKMDETMNDLVQELTALGVPPDKILLTGAELRECDLNHVHNMDIRWYPPREPVPEPEE